MFSSQPFNWCIIGKLPRKLNAVETPRLDAIVQPSDPFKKIKATSLGFNFFAAVEFRLSAIVLLFIAM